MLWKNQQTSILCGLLLAATKHSMTLAEGRKKKICLHEQQSSENLASNAASCADPLGLVKYSASETNSCKHLSCKIQETQDLQSARLPKLDELFKPSAPYQAEENRTVAPESSTEISLSAKRMQKEKDSRVIQKQTNPLNIQKKMSSKLFRTRSFAEQTLELQSAKQKTHEWAFSTVRLCESQSRHLRAFKGKGVLYFNGKRIDLPRCQSKRKTNMAMLRYLQNIVKPQISLSL